MMSVSKDVKCISSNFPSTTRGRKLPFSIFVDSKLTTGDSRQEMFQAKMLNPQSPKVGPQYERRPTSQALVLLRRLGYYILGDVKKIY
jgi:hypothetical protein